MKGRGVGRPSHQTCIVKLLVAFGLELLELRNAARHMRGTAPKSKVKRNEAKQMKNRDSNARYVDFHLQVALGLVLKNGQPVDEFLEQRSCRNIAKCSQQCEVLESLSNILSVC